MTHDELLTKIDVCFAEVPVDYGQVDAHNALRAVVELCKVWNAKGSYCLPINNVIRAIEKELK